MDQGIIPIDKNFELQYVYYEKNPKYKYFNRKFEIFIVEKKSFKKKYVMHMDNADIRQMMPRIFKASSGSKRHDFGVTTLNWNDIKTKFTDYIVSELGEKQRNNIKKAVGKLNSPKI
ncbi:MAG: hypothetical protein JSV67_08850 [Thermoplasmatales archaeon]|jgi:hypothetical protein|nr:MAG: hypothetical protein JSV67_08850 [Thermoplasmatales archaeon]